MPSLFVRFFGDLCFIAHAYVHVPAVPLAARSFCPLHLAMDLLHDPYSSVLFDSFGPLGRKIHCKIHGISATRAGTVRWPVDPAEVVSDPVL